MVSFNYQGIEILGLCGCYEINVPGIFELFDIKYETIPANEFWEVFKQESVHEDSHFILPFVRDVVNTEDVDLTKNNLIGASYLLVDRIEGDRMYLNTREYDVGDEEGYYITKSVYDKLNNNKKWIYEADFEGYRVYKKDLKDSYFVRERLNKTEKELLIDNIVNFQMDNTMIGDEGTIRYEGNRVYEDISGYLENMLELLVRQKGTDYYNKLLQYVYLQLINFRKMIAAGSDGYYRTEFREILSGYDEFKDDLDRWDKIIGLWRSFGRVLAQGQKKAYLCSHAEKVIKQLIEIWKNIAYEEKLAMDILVQKVC